MTQEHPVTPTSELVREWQIKIEYCSKRADREAMVAKIFQLGADHELEACCEWVSAISGKYGPRLRMSRRPKPPSLKAQALEQLKSLEVAFLASHGGNAKTESIRRALDALPD